MTGTRTGGRSVDVAAESADAAVLGKLSALDRFLPVWIGVAMALGLVIGRVLPGVAEALDAAKIDTVSLPIGIGLLVMMYPPLSKVLYAELGAIAADRRLLGASLVLNWLVGPALVAINSVFQIIAYSLLGWFYLSVLPGWLGLEQQALDVALWDIAKAVLVFLGIPLLAGVASRILGERARGREWYEGTFLPRISPWALYGLLATVVMLFALQGDAITSQPLDVARIAVPLLAYFGIMFGMSFALGLRLGLGYARNATLSFTAAGNNFELAIAVAIGVFGATSGQALAGVVGPLIEVPVLVGLVYVALWARRRLYPSEGARPAVETDTTEVRQ